MGLTHWRNCVGFFSYESPHPVETNVFTIRLYFQNVIEVSGLTGNLLEWVWRLGVDAWGWSGAPGMGGSLWRGRGGILYGGGGGVVVRGGVALGVRRLSDPAPLTGFGGGTRLYGPLLSKSTATHRTEIVEKVKKKTYLESIGRVSIKRKYVY